MKNRWTTNGQRPKSQSYATLSTKSA